MVILCADCRTPPHGHEVETSEDGVERMFAVNYLSTFQLLSILSPAIRAQPPGRDVRIVLGTCGSYMGGNIPSTVPLPLWFPQSKNNSKSKHKPLIAKQPGQAYASTKLALMTFACAFQKHLSAYKRPDGQPMSARVLLVDPGFSRTPGMRRYLTWGSLWGLVLYLVCWPLWWLMLKSAEQGAQTFLYAAMEERFGRKGMEWVDGGAGEKSGVGRAEVDARVPLLKECREIVVGGAKEGVVVDEKVQQRLWEVSEKAIEALEKEGAQKRAREKAEAEEEERKKEMEEQTGQKKPGSRKSKKAEKQT